MDDSIYNLEAIVAKAKTSGDPRILAQAQLALAKGWTVKLVSGEVDSATLEKATKVAQEAIKNASTAGDSLTEASALSSLGQLLMLSGESAEPLRNFERAAAIYERKKEHKGAAVCYSGIASVCIKTGDHSRARQALQQAIRHSTEAGEQAQVEKYKLALQQLGGVQEVLSTERPANTSAGFFTWYVKVINNYATFNGRASREEFWSFMALNLLIFFVLGLVEVALGFNNDPDVFVLGGLYNLVILLPTLAVTVRRLHDTGQSGWLVLINAIPGIGWVISLVLLAQKGEDTPNAYGAPNS